MMQTLITALNQWFSRKKAYKFIATNSIAQSLFSNLMRLSFGLLGIVSIGLILGHLAGILMVLIMALIFASRTDNLRNFFIFNNIKETAKEYSMFPKYKLGHVFINYLAGNIPVYVLISYFGSAEAGFFTLGLTFVMRPSGLVSNSMYQVLYQKFTERKNKHLSILPEIQKVTKQLALFSIPAFALIMLAAPFVTAPVFGSEWKEAGLYLCALTPSIASSFIVNPITFVPDLYQAQNKAMQLEIVYSILRVASIFGGVLIGSALAGVILYSITGTLFPFVILSWYKRLIKNESVNNC
jgi:O-antigen/teichoic acid export membrane protein